MKLLVNGVPLLAPLTGIGQYTRQLFTALRADGLDPLMFYGLHCEHGLPATAEVSGTARNTRRAYDLVRKVLPNPRELKRLVERASFAWHARGLASAGYLYHEPNILPQRYAGPTVITVHDLSCFDHPETHPADRVAIMHRELPRAIERADHIIVISEATRRAVQQRFAVPDARLSVTLLAADPRFAPRPAASLALPLAGMQLSPGNYVLCVGTLEPRKNLGVLFEAYAGLPSALRQRFPLVVAGMAGWHTDALMASARQLMAKGELRLLGYVSDALLPLLYAGAAAFAYPSRYEGFGLPPLEAMACGVPVLASSATSLPEVVGDAGLLADPDDVDAMRAGLLRLLDDRAGAQQLAAAGLARAAGFSWARCAAETRAVYRQVAARHGLPD